MQIDRNQFSSGPVARNEEVAPLQSNQAVCIQGEQKESMVNSCLDPRPGRNSFFESSGQNIGQNHSSGNAYNYLLLVGWLDDRMLFKPSHI